MQVFPEDIFGRRSSNTCDLDALASSPDLKKLFCMTRILHCSEYYILFLELSCCVVHCSVLSYLVVQLLNLCLYGISLSKFGAAAAASAFIDSLCSEYCNSLFYLSELSCLLDDPLHYRNKGAGLERSVDPSSLISEVYVGYFLGSALVAHSVQHEREVFWTLFETIGIANGSELLPLDEPIVEKSHDVEREEEVEEVLEAFILLF